MFRSDARELMPGNQDVQRLRQQTVTLAELLRDHTDGWQPPHLGGQGDRADPLPPARHHGLRRGPGAAARGRRRPGRPGRGLLRAGRNFGFEAGHYDVSRACGERVLLPAVRDAAADTLVLADGFSCRTQIEQGGTGRTPVHLAEVLAAGLRGEPVRPSRPAAPGAADYCGWARARQVSPAWLLARWPGGAVIIDSGLARTRSG